MAKAKIQDIRNLVLCGHGGCGKTTLVDNMLVKTGTVTSHPSVDDGSSICDFDPEEKHHKYTIEAKLVHFDHAGNDGLFPNARYHLQDCEMNYATGRCWVPLAGIGQDDSVVTAVSQRPRAPRPMSNYLHTVISQ